MISKYGVFCKVIDLGNFTKAAEVLGYSQSAVSQTIKGLEEECGCVLIDRRKDGIRLTKDGEQYLPFFQDILSAEKSLEQKQKEMKGLESSVITIGAYSSITRNVMPRMMALFKEQYPNAIIDLRQGEHTSIEKWINEGSVDFGFVNSDDTTCAHYQKLYEDEMKVIVPLNHKLAHKDSVKLKEIAQYPLILLNEGDKSIALKAFEKEKITPHIAYEVYDDYSILAMIHQGLGISIMYQFIFKGLSMDLMIKDIDEHPKRAVALGWRNWSTMPLASRRFAEFLITHIDEVVNEKNLLNISL